MRLGGSLDLLRGRLGGGREGRRRRNLDREGGGGEEMGTREEGGDGGRGRSELGFGLRVVGISFSFLFFLFCR